MERSRRSWVRGAIVLGLSGTMMAAALMSPALAVRLATTKYVKAVVNKAIGAFRTEAEARFLDVAEGDGRYVENGTFVVRGAPLTIPAGSENFAEADCPAGTTVVGGGGYSTATYMFLEASYPSDGTNTDTDGAKAWTVWAFNDSGGPSGQLFPYAICMKTDATLQFGPARTAK